MTTTGTKNSRSPIWNYFVPVNQKNTRCLCCLGLYRNSGNTTNLFDHLKRRHRPEYLTVLEAMKQIGGGGGNSTGNDSKSAETYDNTEIPIAVENIKFETGTETIMIETENDIHQMEEEQVNNENELENEEINETDIEQNVELQGEEHNVQVVKIVPLPHARSEVWTYFGFVADNDGQIIDRSKVVCKICATTLCYSGNTTNFYSHLKSMHSEVQMRAVPNKNSKILKRTYSNMVSHNDESNDLGDDMENDVNDSLNDHSKMDETISTRSRDDIIYVEDITQAVVDFLVTDCRPICVVQGKGFQRLLRLLAPDYMFPDRQKLALAVRKRYDDMRNENIGNSSSIEKLN